MAQKTNSTYYLLFGIGFIFLFCISCKKHYQSSAEYHYINKTNYDITFGKGLDAYNLAPNGSYTVASYQDSQKDIDPRAFIPPLMIKSSGGVTIKFDLIQCLDLKFNSEHSPLNIDSYINNGKIGESTYRFTYTFTEADYNRAVVCP